MMAAYERANKKTPCGGDYSEIFYFDDNGNPVEAEEATKFVIIHSPLWTCRGIRH